MVFVLELENFQGPFDVLLKLLTNHKLDITDVSLAEVTAEYLDYIAKIDLNIEEMNWFLFVATKLALDKSQLMLKITPDYNDDDIDIAESLQQYQHIKNMATAMAAQSKAPMYGRGNNTENSTKRVDLSNAKLNTIFLSLLEKHNKRPKTKKITSKKLIIEDLKKRFCTHIAKIKKFSSFEVIEKSDNKFEAIIYFLTLLELINQGKVNGDDCQFVVEAV